MSDETTLRECPFCGGEARLVNDYSIEKGMRYQIWHECTGHEGRSGGYGQGIKPFFETPWYPTDAEAITAWNTRATCGTLTAEQVREAIERHVKFYEGGDYDEQVIADELNARLGSEREKALEKLVRSLYADYRNEWPDRAEEEYAERMRELGLG